MRDKLELNSKTNFCTVCGEEVTGNVRPEIEVDIVCGRCTAGRAEWVKNRPDEFPIPVAVPKQRRMRKTKWDKKMDGKTLSDC
jgi:hypothetical protein